MNINILNGAPDVYYGGIIGAIILFVIQLFFCFKMKRFIVKLIPVYCIIICTLLCIMEYIGVFGSQSYWLDVNKIAAIFLGIVVVISTIGDIAAWITYIICKKHKCA